MRSELSGDEARRIALAAQGFADPRPSGRVDARHLRRVIDRVGVVQLDSVNVVVRAHYMPFYSRLGPYPRHTVDDLAHRRRELFEYWAHAACLIPVEHEPLFRHRMEERAERWRSSGGPTGRFDPDGYSERVLDEIRRRGPLGVSDLEDPGQRNGPWWGWGRGKRALEYHWNAGTLATAGRRNFERLYDLRERVLPPHILELPTPHPDDARRALLLLAAKSYGVGTARDLADYYRLPLPESRGRLEELADAGELTRVRVEGWAEPAYLHAGARLPRRIEARALLSPFDSLVWAGWTAKRDRIERLFGFEYVLEIYIPEPKRTYGYYVMPFLLGDRLVARVDLKAGRAGRTLRVPAAYLEAGTDASEVADALADELRSMAAWLGLERVEVGNRGDLAGGLRRAVLAAGAGVDGHEHVAPEAGEVHA